MKKQSFDKIIGFWVNKLLNDKNFKPILIFGFYSQDFQKNHIKNVEIEIKHLKKFQKKFIALIKSYEFDMDEVEHSYASINFPKNTLQKPSKVPSVNTEINELLKSIETKLLNLTSSKEYFKRNNIIKSGRLYIRLPLHFAKMVCIGLEVFSDSESDLTKFRNFIESNNKLRTILEKKHYDSKVIDKLITNTGHSDITIWEWKRQKKDSMKESILACKIGKHVTSISKHKRDWDEIEQMIKHESADFLRAVSKKRTRNG